MPYLYYLSPNQNFRDPTSKLPRSDFRSRNIRPRNFRDPTSDLETSEIRDPTSKFPTRLPISKLPRSEIRPRNIRHDFRSRNFGSEVGSSIGSEVRSILSAHKKCYSFYHPFVTLLILTHAFLLL